ncbi:hypothetical protein RclHR1_01800017 [Rhizophagus clarus]|uniref:SbsA Ig-like domain-containing protein n=1 Tax=Rhizophagus clarus TaxID=94130 RepID=A0A2Z6QQJ9_9GLOM|nr:hypothetical protein RclHR1_01800017 [Rhizophagus clarus]
MTKPINEICIEPRIDLRILYRNGTIEVARVDYPIPEFNFCNGTFQIENYFPNYLLVLYVNSTDIDSASYYALLIDYAGNFISNTYLAPVSVINGSLYTNGTKITPYITEEYGFLFTTYENETVVSWSYFNGLDAKENIIKINNGTQMLNIPFGPYFVSPRIEGNFIFIKYNPTNFEKNCVESNDPTEIMFEVFVSYIKPIVNGVDGPFIIYQSTIPHLSVDKFVCSNTRKCSNINYDSHATKLELNNLYYGGFLLSLLKRTSNTVLYNLQGSILDNDGIYYKNWDFSPDLMIYKGSYAIGDFNNGTMYLITQNDEFSWKISSSNLPKISNDYNNPCVNSTYPAINSNISLSTPQISITYNMPVTLSINNFSIYQDDNGTPRLRQSAPGNPSKVFKLGSDNRTVYIDVLESTFNKPNANYYIVIDDNAVKDLISNQPLAGVGKSYWSFKTSDINDDKFADDSYGTFSLTADGTKYYNNLSRERKSEFGFQLKTDLASAIPVDVKRLDIKCCEFNKDQIVFTLSIKCKNGLNKNERNVVSVIKDLDMLIKDKEMTPISWSNTTNLIDANYGFQQNYDIFDCYKSYIISILIGIIIIGLFYYYIRKKYPMGKNIYIFKFSLILLDFIIDITFILVKGNNVKLIFIPSIIFCAVPTTINIILSVFIVLREIIKNKAFYKWFRNNTSIAALFTILAGADVEVLNILSSQIAGVMMLNAPFSDKAGSYIFWGSFLKFFIEDIPQLIIQVSKVKKN